LIWITSANTNKKYQTGKENVFPDSSRNYSRNENITEELERNLQTQFQLQNEKNWKMLNMINKNHNKRILNYILRGKSNAEMPIKKYCTKGNKPGHCPNP
jgi:hypothetical protein